ncbi:MAG: AraC family transcriptional regulator [Pseudomonadota bacterium]
MADRDAQAIARARDVLLDSLSRNIPIETLAREVGVSPFRLMRCFKAEMGQTIHQFVIEHRVAFVRDRISRSDDPLAQIAFDAGFANQSHMTSAYTAMMGISPGKHRRELRG